MAAENPIARFESELDVHAAELRSFKWFIAPAIVFAVFVIARVQVLLAARPCR